jgi:hypothetical protein
MEMGKWDTNTVVVPPTTMEESPPSPMNRTITTTDATSADAFSLNTALKDHAIIVQRKRIITP